MTIITQRKSISEVITMKNNICILISILLVISLFGCSSNVEINDTWENESTLPSVENSESIPETQASEPIEDDITDFTGMSDSQIVNYFNSLGIDEITAGSENQKAPEYACTENAQSKIGLNILEADPSLEFNAKNANAVILGTVTEVLDGYYSHPEAREYYERTGERLMNDEGTEVVESRWVTSFKIEVSDVFYSNIDYDFDGKTIQVSHKSGQPDLFYLDLDRIDASGYMVEFNLYMRKGARYILFLSKIEPYNGSDFLFARGSASLFVSLQDIDNKGRKGIETKYSNGSYILDTECIEEQLSGLEFLGD